MDSGVSCSRSWNPHSGARDMSCPVTGAPQHFVGCRAGLQGVPIPCPRAGSQPGAGPSLVPPSPGLQLAADPGLTCPPGLGMGQDAGSAGQNTKCASAEPDGGPAAGQA